MPPLHPGCASSSQGEQSGVIFAWKAEEFGYCEQHVRHVVKHFVNILIPALERAGVCFLSAWAESKSVAEKNWSNFQMRWAGGRKKLPPQFTNTFIRPPGLCSTNIFKKSWEDWKSRFDQLHAASRTRITSNLIKATCKLQMMNSDHDWTKTARWSE